MRMHPDLYGEVITLARRQGLPVSLWVERALIASVHAEAGRVDLLDAIGRYRSTEDPHSLTTAARENAIRRAARDHDEAIRKLEEAKHVSGRKPSKSK
jgi:hypothetical protein